MNRDQITQAISESTYLPVSLIGALMVVVFSAGGLYVKTEAVASSLDVVRSEAEARTTRIAEESLERDRRLIDRLNEDQGQRAAMAAALGRVEGKVDVLLQRRD